jgi:hypothetical protein
MKYLLLINHGAANDAFAAMGEDDQKAYYAAWGELTATPGVTPGVRMEGPETATTVTTDASGAALVTDGPFAELKEAVGGYFILEAEDLDAAIAVAQKVPVVKLGGKVEIRPLVEAGW